MARKKRPWYKKDEYILLLLVVCFPVGLYLMWRYARWNQRAKMLFTAIIAFLVVLVLLIGSCASSSGKKLKSAQISTEGPMELEIGEVREIKVQVTPKKFDIKNLTYNVDDPTLANFLLNEEGVPCVVALQPGVVIVSVSSGKKVSNTLLFTIKEPEIQQPAEPVIPRDDDDGDNGTVLVKTTSDVNIRSGPGTGYDVYESASKGSTFTLLEDLGTGWSRIAYGDTDAYISSKYLEAAE